MEKLFTINDLAEYFDVSKRTIQTWRDINLIEFYQIKGKIFFSKKHIDNFLKKHYIKSK